MGKLNEKSLKAMLSRPPRRYPDGQGLYFKTIGLGRAYFTYRFCSKAASANELGPFPGTEARAGAQEARGIARRVLNGHRPAWPRSTPLRA